MNQSELCSTGRENRDRHDPTLLEDATILRRRRVYGPHHRNQPIPTIGPFSVSRESHSWTLNSHLSPSTLFCSAFIPGLSCPCSALTSLLSVFSSFLSLCFCSFLSVASSSPLTIFSCSTLFPLSYLSLSIPVHLPIFLFLTFYISIFLLFLSYLLSLYLSFSFYPSAFPSFHHPYFPRVGVFRSNPRSNRKHKLGRYVRRTSRVFPRSKEGVFPVFLRTILRWKCAYVHKVLGWIGRRVDRQASSPDNGAWKPDRGLAVEICRESWKIHPCPELHRERRMQIWRGERLVRNWTMCESLGMTTRGRKVYCMRQCCLLSVEICYLLLVYRFYYLWYITRKFIFRLVIITVVCSE